MVDYKRIMERRWRQMATRERVMVDYKRILEIYVSGIVALEGSAFASTIAGWGELTEEEAAELIRIGDEQWSAQHDGQVLRTTAKIPRAWADEAKEISAITDIMRGWPKVEGWKLGPRRASNSLRSAPGL